MNNPTHDTPMSLIDHLTELRTRLIKVMMFFVVMVGVCFYFAQEIFVLLVIPLKQALGEQVTVSYFAPHETFFVYMNLSLYAALIISVPIIIHQIWAFVAPGLYYSEQKAIKPFLFLAPMMFVVGGLFAYHFVLPSALAFFSSFQASVDHGDIQILQQIRVQEYAHFALSFILVFGVTFELPVILILLGIFGVISATDLKQYRKYAILIIATISAIVTPPDLISMFGLAIPLQLLYEISIIIIQLCERKKYVKKD
jgi:sec-independent protein translocase protein TatC